MTTSIFYYNIVFSQYFKDCVLFHFQSCQCERQKAYSVSCLPVSGASGWCVDPCSLPTPSVLSGRISDATQGVCRSQHAGQHGRLSLCWYGTEHENCQKGQSFFCVFDVFSVGGCGCVLSAPSCHWPVLQVIFACQIHHLIYLCYRVYNHYTTSSVVSFC